MSETTPLNIAPAFRELFEPDSPAFPRKIFYCYPGGRSSGKSHALATAAVLRAIAKKERILCVREVLNTIADSLYRLLVDKIKSLGLHDFFEITDKAIRCKPTGSSFLFKGLGTSVDDTVRSVEAVTITICEESQAISEHSWSVLLPSVLRTEGSEVWVAYNPVTFEDPVHKRFIEGYDPVTMHVTHVNYDSNPYLPKNITQLLEADRKRDPEAFENIWLGRPRRARQGGIFLGEKISIVPAAPAGLRKTRCWDLASSAVIEKRNGVITDPDYSVGLLMSVCPLGIYYIEDVVRLRGTPDVVEQAVLNTAALDGYEVPISMAQDPGQAGVAQAQYYARKLAGYRFHTSPESGSKATRAEPLASIVNSSNLRIVKAPWNEALVNEFKGFNGEKNGGHDDQVDAASRAFTRLAAPQALQKMKIF